VLRAVVDTNVWVSVLIDPAAAPALVLAAFLARRFVPIVSEPLLAELQDVLGRPRLRRRYGISAVDAADLIALVKERAEVVEVVGGFDLCRDPDDDIVIETAVRGRANAVVPQDDDLKGASDVVQLLSDAGIAVLTVRQFLDRLPLHGDAP